VSYSIFNEADEEALVLSYGTPFEGMILFPVLNITHNGEPVQYVGPLGRRVTPPPPHAFFRIPPQSALNTVVDLAQFYEIPFDGSFEISATVPLFNPTLENALVAHPIVKRLRSTQQKVFGDRANTYEQCTATEKSQIDSAATTAQRQAQNAKNCMSAGSCNSQTTTWFGSSTTKNTGYYNYDLEVFTNVYNELASDGIHAYCNPAGCGSNVYAYVYPSDPSMTVYLCGAFWSQANERANTIVHEMSHFNVLGGTEDYTYGKVSCQNLAKSNPYQAAHNADNVCYFSDDV